MGIYYSMFISRVSAHAMPIIVSKPDNKIMILYGFLHYYFFVFGSDRGDSFTGCLPVSCWCWTSSIYNLGKSYRKNWNILIPCFCTPHYCGIVYFIHILAIQLCLSCSECWIWRTEEATKKEGQFKRYSYITRLTIVIRHLDGDL